MYWVRFPEAQFTTEVSLSKERKEMTPTDPIIEALAWSFIGGLITTIAIILAYDCIRVVIGWFK